MRVWEFDRLGGIASEQFDVNTSSGGRQFVATILGFLWMNEDRLGLDPTIITSDGERYIEIERDGQKHRLVLDELILRKPCIAGRATTCWKAHCKEDPQTPLVIKDSWQDTRRGEEGALIQEATEKGVVNVARHYHHETVRVRGADDDVQRNIRKGIDVTKAKDYKPPNSSTPRVPRKGRSSGSATPPGKRLCLPSPTVDQARPNKVHRRVIVRDYGKPIYEASSHAALLAALEGCIEGHESLHRAGLLHRDIAIGNLMMNEDEENPSWRAFLIDLDFAIRDQRQGASGAKRKIGTKPFMAIGALLGEQHSFMHDLESFFWVLYGMCIGSTRLKDWSFMNMDKLATLKVGTVSHEELFLRNFTSHYRPLIPAVNELRKVVFPNSGRWRETEDERLYSQMKEVLREAREKITGSDI